MFARRNQPIIAFEIIENLLDERNVVDYNFKRVYPLTFRTLIRSIGHKDPTNELQKRYLEIKSRTNKNHQCNTIDLLDLSATYKLITHDETGQSLVLEDPKLFKLFDDICVT